MPLKVGEIPYLNCAPFYWDKKIRVEAGLGIEWVPLPPKALGQLARRAEIDAGPLSLMDSFDVEPYFEPLSDLGIAVQRHARSVLLFSKRNIAELKGQKLGVSSETSTSSELLKVILRGRYGFDANYSAGFSEQDEARLLIGDSAIRAIQDPVFFRMYNHIYDLGEEWNNWQNLPFVFARWMVRKELAESSKNRLSDYLKHNLEFALKDPGMILSKFPLPSFINAATSAEYLKAFTYYLGAREKESIQVFRAFLEKLDIGAGNAR